MGATTSAPAAAIKPTLPADARLIDAINLLTAGKWAPDDYQAWHELHLAHQIAKAKPATGPAGELRFKVSDKGAVSVYGLQSRFPVTLYAPQWERLFASRESLAKFIADNAGTLSREKPAKQEAPTKPATIQPAGPIAPAITPELLAALGAMLTAQQSA